MRWRLRARRSVCQLLPLLLSMSAPRRTAAQADIDEPELRRRDDERVSDWSEPGAVTVDRSGKR